MTTPPRTPRLVSLQWGVRDSLLSYLAATVDLKVTASGGATFAPETGIEVPGVLDDSGVVHACGSITLSAHGGDLVVPVVNASIEAGSLWVDDPFTDDGETGRLRIVEIVPAADREAVADGVDSARAIAVYQTRLAPDGEALFGYRYPPGAEFAALTIRPRPVGP